MESVVTSTKNVLELLVQGIVLVVPLVISWFVRTYVQGTTNEKKLASIVRLSGSAIDYVENLDRRGELSVPPNVKKGAHKLRMAAEWLSSESRRAGITVPEKAAGTWIASEYQKRVGEVRPVDALLEVARAAVNVVQNLEGRLVDLPAGEDRTGRLSELAADWMVAQMAQRGAALPREEALTWVRAELVQRLQTQLGEAPADNRLARLAKGAVAFLEGLKSSGQLAVRPGSPGQNVETDLAAAWLLTEAAKQGLPVTADQIAEAIGTALRERVPAP